MKSLINFLNPLNILLASAATTDPDYNSSISPIYEFIDTFGPYILSAVIALCSIYAIVLMVQYVKAEDASARDTQKKKVINAIISMVVVIVLLALLYGLRDTFVGLMNDTNW